jgi:hypothetical protein
MKKNLKNKLEPVSIVISEPFERRIFFMRGKAVMIDMDLAELYETTSGALNQAVKRNISRFPVDFMFMLSNAERQELITNCDRFASMRHNPSNPHAFTEQGVAMLSSVLRSDRAIQVNIEIMRAFVDMRKAMLANKSLAQQVEKISKTVTTHGKHIAVLSDIVHNLIEPPIKPKRKIGFRKRD